jgi:hypothetical protein
MTKETKGEAEVKTASELDLASLDTATASEKGAIIPIVHPTTKEPIGINIKVLGKHSDTFRELVRDRINKRVKQESMAARRGKHLDPRTAEEIERDALEMLVACTLGWDSGEGKDYIFFEGQQLKYSPQNALTVYSKLIWLREQVDEAIGDLENFIQA